jgi:hypothetical protein
MDPASHQNPSRESVQDLDRDLLSPISIATLDTPASRSSLTFPDSAEISPTTVPVRPVEEDPFCLRPESDSAVPPKTGAFKEQTKALTLTDADRALEMEPTYCYHRANTPPKATNATLRECIEQTYEASKKLQQVLGLQQPVAFKTPPNMPYNLIDDFKAGLVEYGLGEELSRMTLAERERQQTDTQMAGQDIQQVHPDKGKVKAKVTDDTQMHGHGQPVAQQDTDIEATAAPPVLFPAANIEADTEVELLAEDPAARPANVDGFLESLFSRPPPPASPKVISTPLKVGRLKGKDRKRARAESQKETARPAPSTEQKKARTGGIVGISTLPAAFTAAWLTMFPGNCPYLSQILLRWHHTMTTLYRRCEEDYLVDIHPMFPYPPTRPVNIPLVSVSFWDTSAEPHRELRFIGPGDVSSILYAEVDTFHSDEAIKDSPFAKAMARGLVPNAKDLRKVDMRARNERGEGRWCFIVINGHKDKENTAPYVTIAWPITAVTSRSECLHTISPDTDNTQPPSSSASSASTFPSKINMMPNMYPGFLISPGIHAALRATTSSILPSPPVQGKGKGLKKDGLTVRRTTLVFGKAGGVPLVQAWRTDAKGWMGWMDAVGKGEGKVMMACEVK